jgi:glycosyltransferase involved in cell wall biosynthesis
MNYNNRIFHLTDDFSPQSGVTGMITQLDRYLAGKGWTSTVLLPEGQWNPPPRDNFITFPLVLGGMWSFPWGLKSYLQESTREPGAVFHLHGVWMGFQWLAARTAQRQKVSVLLSPHGMLNRWHLRYLGFKEIRKLVYWHTVAYRTFQRVQVIHAVTPRERDELAKWFPDQRIAIIPNALDLEEMDHLLAETGNAASPSFDEPYVLFLGRLHPVKGIELLIEAFGRSIKGSQHKFRLLIVGPDSDPVYSDKLKALVGQLGLGSRVTFWGPARGAQKVGLYRHAWVFCAPSQVEVMGLVNLEAAAVRAPVVTTYETGLCGWEEGGGILVHPRVEDLSRALTQAFSWSERERFDRGQQLRRLVEKRYSWQAVGPQWLELYANLA